MLTLLRRTLSARRKCINSSRGIDEGDDIAHIARECGIEPIKIDFQLHFKQRWWLERLFDRIHLSFAQGSFLVYLLMTVLPRLFFLPIVIPSKEEAFKLGFGATFIGELIIIVILLSLHLVQKGLIEVGKSMNESFKRNKLVSPPSLILPEGDLLTDEQLASLDKNYQDLYAKPVLGRVLQGGFDLAFDRSYQLGSGAIAAIFFAISMILFAFNIVPPSIFRLWLPIPEMALAWTIYAFFIIGFLWFLVGMLAWTLFVVFLVIIQVSSSTIGVHSYESIKEYFEPATSLTLKVSLTLMVLVGWFSPYMLLWSMLPPEESPRLAAVNFLLLILVVMLPIIVISFSVPVLKIHKGLLRSRDRALLIKRDKLEALRRSPPADLERYLQIQTHLMQDYKDISQSPEWVLNLGQVVQIVAAIVLPVVTYLLSQIFWRALVPA